MKRRSGGLARAGHLKTFRNNWAWYGVTRAVGLPTISRLLGHRRGRTAAIYGHVDDNALQGAAALTASLIAEAMRFRAETVL